jgi:hypothetical protein
MKRLDIYGLIHATYAAYALYVLTTHEVFDALVRGPRTISDLALRCGLQPRSLEQLLLTAVSLGYLRRVGEVVLIENKAFVLTKPSQSWLRSYLLIWGEQMNPAFGHLEAWATKGENPFAAAKGAKLWEFYRQNSKAHERFVEFQDAVTDQVHTPLIASLLEVGDARQMVDVAGGKGSVACSVLAKHPQLHAIVFDQRHMQQAAIDRIERAHLSSRCRFVGGSMLESVPEGADLYLIKHVIHAWPDRGAVQILSNIRSAMPAASRLVLIEGVLDHDCGDSEFLQTRNLEQMAWTDGKVRTLGEFKALTRAAGLEIRAVNHTVVNDLSFLECTRSE